MSSELQYEKGSTSTRDFHSAVELSVDSATQLTSLLVVALVALLLFRRTRDWIWLVLAGGALVTLILPLLIVLIPPDGTREVVQVAADDGPSAVSTRIVVFSLDPFTAFAALGMLVYWITLLLKGRSGLAKTPQ